MFVDVKGPYAGAGNDLNMLQQSNTLAEVNAFAVRAGVPLSILCDKIYDINANGLAALRQRAIGIEEEEEEDAAASAARVPIEWAFGKIALMFPFIDNPKALKIGEREISVYILVASLLTN